MGLEQRGTYYYQDNFFDRYHDFRKSGPVQKADGANEDFRIIWLAREESFFEADFGHVLMKEFNIDIKRPHNTFNPLT